MSLKLLLISEDPVFAQALAAQLAQAGFDCCLEAGGEGVDVVLLDGASTPDPCLGPALRLIKDGESSEEEHLVKPVRLAQLAQALERAAQRAQSQRKLKIGPWCLELGSGLLSAASGRQKLTGKEAEILAYLHDHPGRVSREDLLENVWGYGSAISTHTLETHIYRLRQKLEADPSAPTVLVTDEGGYRLIAPSS
ncbi:MAG: winged helix-turn-helix domain-containing protein [Alphaproteobacteria bacterium]|nr:winged helix-turn-helix domain-containing protein [Alphaproteobacteria bacterium]